MRPRPQTQSGGSFQPRELHVTTSRGTLVGAGGRGLLWRRHARARHQRQGCRGGQQRPRQEGRQHQRALPRSRQPQCLLCIRRAHVRTPSSVLVPAIGAAAWLDRHLSWGSVPLVNGFGRTPLTVVSALRAVRHRHSYESGDTPPVRCFPNITPDTDPTAQRASSAAGAEGPGTVLRRGRTDHAAAGFSVRVNQSTAAGASWLRCGTSQPSSGPQDLERWHRGWHRGSRAGPTATAAHRRGQSRRQSARPWHDFRQGRDSPSASL